MNDDAFDPQTNTFSLDSYLQFTAPDTGEYFVGVSAYQNWSYNANDGSGRVDGFSTGAFNLLLSLVNTPPTVNAGGPYAVSEGGSVTLAASGSDPDGDNLSYAWDLDNNGSYETGGRIVAFSAASRDGNSSQTVGVRAFDGRDYAYDTATVNVTNVAPTITSASSTSPVPEGSPVTVNVAATDPAGANDPLTYQFDFDSDGNYEVSSTTGQASHVYADNGTYTVGVRVTDVDGGVATLAGAAPVLSAPVTLFDFNDYDTTFAPVANVSRLTIASPGGFAHSHGQIVNFTVDVHNVATGAWETVWSTTLTNFAEYHFSNLDVSFAARSVDGVRLTSDPDQFSSYHSWAGSVINLHRQGVQVTVNNVAPMLTLSGNATADEGGTYTLGLSSSDPGADTVGHWTVNWGDGSPAQTVVGDPSSTTHVYADNGSYTISAMATDEDGTYVAGNTVTVAVANVAPTLSDLALSETDIDEGGSTTLSGTIADPGAADTFTVAIDWDGDGTTDESHTGVAAGAFSYAHTYADDDPTGTPSDDYTIGVTVTDDDGDSAQVTANVITVPFQGHMISTGVPQPPRRHEAPPPSRRQSFATF
jgi:PKD repeat protein